MLRLVSRELEQGGDTSFHNGYSFAPWEHIVAYRMMKKIEAGRQLKTDEVNKAVEGKFAERLLLQSVNKKLEDERVSTTLQGEGEQAGGVRSYFTTGEEGEEI